MRRLRLLFGISVFWLALSAVFDGMSSLVLPSQLLGTGDDSSRATTLGLITFVGLLAAMLVQPIAGAFGDRLRPRRGRLPVLALGVGLLLAALVLFGVASVPFVVFLAYLLVQVAASVAQSAQQGFIPDLVDEESRGAASGLKLTMDVGGALLGFVVIGALLAGGEVGPALSGIAAIVIVTFLLTVILVREPRQAAGELVPRVGLGEVFSLDLRRDRAFILVVVARFLFLLGTYAIGRFLLFFVADRLGFAPGQAAEAAGGLLAGLTLLTLLAALPAGWLADRLGRQPLMLAGAALSAAGALALTLAASQWQVLAFGGLMAVGSGAFSSASWALLADVVPKEEAARYFGLANFGTAGAAAAAGLFGPLVDLGNSAAAGGGYQALFIASAFVFAASAVATRGLTGVVRRQTT